jgi:hypothetical protein
MTTDLRMLRAANVFVDNDVLRLPSDASAAGLELAGAAWLTTGEPAKDAHRRSLRHAMQRLLASESPYSLWLLVCHTAWQIDSRLVRHRRLWGSLKARGLEIPFGRDAGEHLIEGSEGLRFFGALQLAPTSVASVAAILEAEPASHLVALNERCNTIAKALVERGWPRTHAGPDSDVLRAVCGENGIVFWPIGAFDDREAGFAVIAKPPLIEQLLR